MDSVETILITGGSSFLGHHLIKHLELYLPNLKSIRVLDETEFIKTLQYDSKITVEWIDGTVFSDEVLRKALLDVQTVFHLYEYKSYSMFVDEKKCQKINVEGTKRLLEACKAAGSVKYFIYGSSVEVMVSYKMHTVNHPEQGRIPYNELAFPQYAKSKLRAEELVLAEKNFQTFIVRIGPMYGELDDSDSWVMNRLRQAKKFGGVLLMVGDRNNVFQHTYVGNVGYGLVCVLKKMADDPSVTKEITFILDHTPYLDMYENITPFLSARKFSLSQRAVPFYPPYYSYCAIEAMVKVFNKYINVSSYFRNWPSSAYFFTYFYNWVFFKSVKCRIFVDYVPLYSFEQAVTNSLPYYANVDL